MWFGRAKKNIGIGLIASTISLLSILLGLSSDAHADTPVLSGTIRIVLDSAPSEENTYELLNGVYIKDRDCSGDTCFHLSEDAAVDSAISGPEDQDITLFYKFPESTVETLTGYGDSIKLQLCTKLVGNANSPAEEKCAPSFFKASDIGSLNSLDPLLYPDSFLNITIDEENDILEKCSNTTLDPTSGVNTCSAHDFTLGDLLKATPTGTGTPGAVNGGTTCAIDGVGWIICPVVRFMSAIADSAFEFLADGFLNIKTEIFKNSDTQEYWGKMRNFANIAFVIGFLIIVYSQLTGMGISNYGVKRLLPRLVVAAILVNLSYYICQILVDLSNILGYSLKTVFDITIDAKKTSGASGVWSGGTTITSIAGGIIAGGAAAAIVWVNLAALIPVLIAGIVALVIILFILIVRQAAIVILIVISPLALVCYLLPNTDGLYKKWQKTFVSLLIVFPVIGIIYGASKAASEIIKSSINGPMGDIVAMATLLLPLFAVPMILKKSIDSLGSVGAKMSGFGSKLGGIAGKKGSGMFENSRLGQYKKYREEEAIKRRALIQSGQFKGNYARFDPRRIRDLRTSANRAINKNSGQFGAKSAASGIAMVSETNAKQINQAQTLMESEVGPGEDKANAIQAQFLAAVKKGDTIKARAAQNILMSGLGANGVKKLNEAYTHLEASSPNGIDTKNDTVHMLRNDINAANLKTKDAVLGAWATKSDGRSIANVRADKETYTNLSDGEIASQRDDILDAAFTSGGLSDQRAQRVIKNGAISGNASGSGHQALVSISRGQRPVLSQNQNTAGTTNGNQNPHNPQGGGNSNP